MEFARRAALDKARAASREFPESLVIGADTVVHLDGKIFGKPADEKEAVSFLHELSGKTHTVTTGVALALASKSIEHVLHADSRVTFKTLSPETIRDYVESGEPMDKAGAYGIQGGGFALVESFSGEYANIVGFPLASFLEELKRFA